jgi:hypothetical protein
MPSLALSVSSGSSKARAAMKSETVKPIPARAAMPMTLRRSTPRGSRPSRKRTASRVAAEIPTS